MPTLSAPAAPTPAHAMARPSTASAAGVLASGAVNGPARAPGHASQAFGQHLQAARQVVQAAHQAPRSAGQQAEPVEEADASAGAGTTRSVEDAPATTASDPTEPAGTPDASTPPALPAVPVLHAGAEPAAAAAPGGDAAATVDAADPAHGGNVAHGAHETSPTSSTPSTLPALPNTGRARAHFAEARLESRGDSASAALAGAAAAPAAAAAAARSSSAQELASNLKGGRLGASAEHAPGANAAGTADAAATTATAPDSSASAAAGAPGQTGATSSPAWPAGGWPLGAPGAATTPIASAAQPAAAAAPPPSYTVAADITSAAFAGAFGAQLSVLARDGIEQARVLVNPEQMGPIAVQLALDGQQVRVDFIAENGHTRQLLQDALPGLASALREGGFTLAGGGVFQQARDGAHQQGQPPHTGAAARAGSRPGEAGEGDLAQQAARARPARVRGLVDTYA